MEEEGRRSDILQVIDGQIRGLADDALVASLGRSYEIRRQFELRVVSESGCQALGWQLDTVSLHTREANLEMVSIGADGPYHHRLPRRRWRHDDGLCREIE